MANEKQMIYLEDAKEALIGWETDPTDDEIEYTLDSLPKVDAVEVVHGRWEKAHIAGYLKCNCCEDAFIYDEWLENGKWNYCPNCGAKMDGERKDNEKMADK